MNKAREFRLASISSELKAMTQNMAALRELGTGIEALAFIKGHDYPHQGLRHIHKIWHAACSHFYRGIMDPNAEQDVEYAIIRGALGDLSQMQDAIRSGLDEESVTGYPRSDTLYYLDRICLHCRNIGVYAGLEVPA